MTDKKIKVLGVIGTRPEAIKMAPVLRELSSFPELIDSVVCVTGQHSSMLQQVLDLFSIKPDYDLKVMQQKQSLASLTARLIDGLEIVVEQSRPDWILAQGDTTTVLAAALVAFYARIPFGHVEAGLRTGNRSSPFPEEMNRRIADQMATLYFTPTERASQTLLDEGVDGKAIILTGNTVVDALLDIQQRSYDWSNGPLSTLPLCKRFVLVTAHRRESFGTPLQEICMAVRSIAASLAGEGVHLVFPVHLNPEVKKPVTELLAGQDNISLLEPLDYLSLVQLMKHSELILTDSGGIQEEAPSLHVPVLVMRDETERPEGVESGFARLVGTDKDIIVSSAIELLRNSDVAQKMVTGSNPYGDGRAAGRIVATLLGNRGR